jgi:hypothetical protein
MRPLRFFLALTFGCCTGLALEQGTNQNAIAQTESQVRSLTRSDVHLIMPRYLPKSFRLTDFKINNNEGYKAVYQGANSCNFSIQAYTPSPRSTSLTNVVRSWNVKSEIFETVELIEFKSDISSDPKYLAVEARFSQLDYYLKFKCGKFSFNHQEATRIIQSLEVKNSLDLKLLRLQKLDQLRNKQR